MCSITENPSLIQFPLEDQPLSLKIQIKNHILIIEFYWRKGIIAQPLPLNTRFATIFFKLRKYRQWGVCTCIEPTHIPVIYSFDFASVIVASSFPSLQAANNTISASILPLILNSSFSLLL